MTRRTAALAALLLAPALAQADPEQDDKLCEVIGEAPNLSIPPKDRLWFKDNCTCAERAGCGKPQSKRFRQRLDAAKKVDEAEAAARAAAEKEREAELREERARYLKLEPTVRAACRAHRACMDDAQRTNCKPELDRWLEVCKPVEGSYLCRNKTVPCD